MSNPSIFINRIDTIILRIDDLLAAKLSEYNPGALAGAQAALSAAQSIVAKLLDGNNIYYKKIYGLSLMFSDNYNRKNIAELRGHLLNIKEEIEAGLLATVESRAQAIVFDDFLDHAKKYVEDGRKMEAGVIVGAVLEDAVRRLCKKHSILGGPQLEQLIIGLKQAKITNDLEDGRLRVGQKLRNNAVHCRWDQFGIEDVREVMSFLNGTLIPKLGS